MKKEVTGGIGGASTAGGVATCTFFWGPVGFIVGGALIGGGINTLKYAVQTSEAEISFKNGAKVYGSGAVAGGLCAAAGPIAGFSASAHVPDLIEYNPALKAMFCKATLVVSCACLCGGINAARYSITEKPTNLSVREFTSSAATGGAVGAVLGLAIVASGSTQTITGKAGRFFRTRAPTLLPPPLSQKIIKLFSSTLGGGTAGAGVTAFSRQDSDTEKESGSTQTPKKGK